MSLFCEHQLTRSSPSTFPNKYLQPGCNAYIYVMTASVIVPAILLKAKKLVDLSKARFAHAHAHTDPLYPGNTTGHVPVKYRHVLLLISQSDSTRVTAWGREPVAAINQPWPGWAPRISAASTQICKNHPLYTSRRVHYLYTRGFLDISYEGGCCAHQGLVY